MTMAACKRLTRKVFSDSQVRDVELCCVTSELAGHAGYGICHHDGGDVAVCDAQSYR